MCSDLYSYHSSVFVQTIVSACIQFQMTTCLSDHKFKRLQQLGEKLQDGEVVASRMNSLRCLNCIFG